MESYRQNLYEHSGVTNRQFEEYKLRERAEESKDFFKKEYNSLLAAFNDGQLYYPDFENNELDKDNNIVQKFTLYEQQIKGLGKDDR